MIAWDGASSANKELDHIISAAYSRKLDVPSLKLNGSVMCLVPELRSQRIWTTDRGGQKLIKKIVDNDWGSIGVRHIPGPIFLWADPLEGV